MQTFSFFFYSIKNKTTIIFLGVIILVFFTPLITQASSLLDSQIAQVESLRIQIQELESQLQQMEETVAKSCTLDGVSVAEGESVTFYKEATIPTGYRCIDNSQQRICENGSFTGDSSFAFSTCEEGITNSCSLPSGSFQGDVASSIDSGLERFMMLSSYNLEPYSNQFVKNVLADLSRNNIVGIIYSSLGEISEKLKSKGYNDEIDFNKEVYAEAKDQNTDLWLQLRVYANQLTVNGETRTYNASEILSDKKIRRIFRDRVKKEVYQYQKNFPNTCKVIVFEEAGIYHSAQGGGNFWSYPEQVLAGSDIKYPNAEYDEYFASRMKQIYRLVHFYVKSVNPNCEVGMHLGHSVFLNEPKLSSAFSWLEKKKVKPDFIFYDLYEKSSPNMESYTQKLTERKAIIDRLGVKSYHLGQLHTMNDFGHGKAATPSMLEIDAYTRLSQDLKFDGFGFYTKNALPTDITTNNPFDANEKGQRPVFESSKDRWDYGTLKLRELSGLTTTNSFDLIITGKFGQGNYEVSLKNASGTWDFIGSVDPNNKKGIIGGYKNAVIVFRSLDATKYLKNGTTTIRFQKGIDVTGSHYIDDIYIVPSRSSDTYRSLDSIKSTHVSDLVLPESQAYALENKVLSQGRTDIDLCIAELVDTSNLIPSPTVLGIQISKDAKGLNKILETALKLLQSIKDTL